MKAETKETLEKVWNRENSVVNFIKIATELDIERETIECFIEEKYKG